IAMEEGLGNRINTVLQTCFFMLNQDLLPLDAAIAAMKEEIVATYGKRGPEVVERNFNAIERDLAAMELVKVPVTVTPPSPDILPLDAAIAAMKEEIVATYGKRGPEVVERNFNAIERALAAMEQVKVPDTAPPPLPVSLPPELEGATDFVRRTTAVMMEGRG